MFSWLLPFLILLSQVCFGQETIFSPIDSSSQSSSKFLYVHEGKELILAELNPQDSEGHMALKTLTLGSIVKTFHGVQLDLVASPSSFRDQIACFVMHEKIGKDEQKLVVVDTLGDNPVEFGAYRIKFHSERRPGVRGMVPGNFVRSLDFRRPQWSPDGKRIMVASIEGLFVVEVNTRRQKRLGKIDRVEDAIWNRDGNQIYFTDGKDLFSIDSSGGDEKRLPKPEGHWRDKGNLTLAPDRTKLFFSNGFRVYSINLVDSTYKELFKFNTGIYALEAVPASEKLVCVIGDIEAFQLMVLDTNTKKRKALKEWSASGADLVAPSVSPDGQFVLFSLKEINGNYQIHLVDIEGKKLSKVTKDGDDNYPYFLR